MTYVKFNTTVESKAADTQIIPINDGQFLIVTDTKKLIYDCEDERIELCDIIELDTEAQRSALLTPLNKFYFVKDTGVLWRYNAGTWLSWTTGSSSGSNEIISDTEPEGQSVNDRWLEIL